MLEDVSAPCSLPGPSAGRGEPGSHVVRNYARILWRFEYVVQKYLCKLMASYTFK